MSLFDGITLCDDILMMIVDEVQVIRERQRIQDMVDYWTALWNWSAHGKITYGTQYQRSAISDIWNKSHLYKQIQDHMELVSDGRVQYKWDKYDRYCYEWRRQVSSPRVRPPDMPSDKRKQRIEWEEKVKEVKKRQTCSFNPVQTRQIATRRWKYLTGKYQSPCNYYWRMTMSGLSVGSVVWDLIQVIF